MNGSSRPFPELRTERLVLRRLVDSDAAAITRLCQDREIAAGTLTIPYPYSHSDAVSWLAMDRQRFEAGTSLVWGIATQDGELVGTIGLNPDPAHDRAELGYWVGKAFWGRGYASEAGAAVLDYAFSPPPAVALNRVYAAHYPWNAASGRVLEKIGLKREGVLRSCRLSREGLVNEAIYGLLRSDWMRRDGRA